MALEQLFLSHDTEDEVDDNITDFEDRRMLDDFANVSKDEKLIMHMQNSFVRKQRTLADGNVPLGLRSVLLDSSTATCAKPSSAMVLALPYDQTLELAAYYMPAPCRPATQSGMKN